MDVHFITVHDANAPKKHRPRPYLIRVDAIDSLRGYAKGTVRCVIGVHGVFHHVEETEEEILEMLARGNGNVVYK